jgi:hypothetical protein
MTWVPDHDHAVLQHLLGQPLVVGPYLAFVNHDQLSICTVPFPGRNAELTRVELADTLRQLAPQRVDLWGWQVAETADRLSGYEPVALRIDPDYSPLIRIDPSRYGPSSSRARRVQEHTRRLEEEGVTIRSGVVGPLGSYTALLERNVEKAQSALEKEFIQSFRVVYDSPGTFVFTALASGRPIGFFAARMLDELYAYSGWVCAERRPKNVSDALYETAIRHFVSQGVTLDLGYGVSPSLCAYKVKWGPTDILPPRRYLSLTQCGHPTALPNQTG